MTTILILNAVSSLIATVGIGAGVARRNRRLGRETAVRPVYVTTGSPRPGPRAAVE
jgi:hypothetical protein